MPISTDHIGRSYPPSEPYTVSAAKIAEFAGALGGVDGGDQNAAYRGDDAIAPPTFAVVLAAHTWNDLFADPELGLALKRTMHGDQTFTHDRPLRVGDRVVAQLTIDKVRVRTPLEWITVRVDLTTVEGEHVCTATSTLLHTQPVDEAVPDTNEPGEVSA